MIVKRRFTASLGTEEASTSDEARKVSGVKVSFRTKFRMKMAVTPEVRFLAGVSSQGGPITGPYIVLLQGQDFLICFLSGWRTRTFDGSRTVPLN